METRGNSPRPSGPLDQLNDPGESFKNPLQLEFVRQLVRAIRDGFMWVLHRDQAAPYFHLVSGGGRVFKVTVNDDGTLRTDHIRG